ncbi:MAG TPA: UDP-N-acetylglucosamine 2-epimerase (non-hydrolyzing) [Methanomicrobiales archaeon]|nr:UDP-N-acetylglucosamine 2-epimerase (non-hydrolyzing) [Methanomicrobiales archaeon]
MKIASIVGARPQFIKCAPLSREIRKEFDEVLIHTGQHYDPNMSGIFFSELDIPLPDYNLGIGSGSHGRQTGRMLMALEKVLLAEKPSLVLVYGDTNTTLAGAITASKLQVPLAHVEAGLRSRDRRMPEEINRVIADRISDLLFCPTAAAVLNLEKEGCRRGVHLTGDVMVDALRYNLGIAEEASGVLDLFGVKDRKYLVATVHRQSNTDDAANLRNIIDGFRETDFPVIFPVHPRTRKFLAKYNLLKDLPGSLVLAEPLGYLDMLRLMAHARKIVTDSGGIQKEAYLLRVPCITLRENSEWMETVEDGWNVLAGTDPARIRDLIANFSPAKPTRDLFGDGNSSGRIVSIIREFLGG